jgi:L-amino acid N-acyltransferase YncA
MDTVIRESTPQDITAITAIYRHAVLHGTGSFEVDPPDAAEMAMRRTTIVDAGYPYLVAERAGAVVGYSYAGVYRTRPA